MTYYDAITEEVRWPTGRRVEVATPMASCCNCGYEREVEPYEVPGIDVFECPKCNNNEREICW